MKIDIEVPHTLDGADVTDKTPEPGDEDLRVRKPKPRRKPKRKQEDK